MIRYMIPSPLVCGVCASNLALIFEVCVPQTIRMSDKRRVPVTCSTTAAGKIMRLVSQVFVPMAAEVSPPFTGFTPSCNDEEAWAFERLVELFPEDEREKEGILSRVEGLCDSCPCCVKPTQQSLPAQ